MKTIHFLLGLFLYLALVAAGLGLILAHQFPCIARTALDWMLARPLWQHVLMGVGILVWLALYFLTGLPRRRPQFIRFENETGSINVSTDAVRKYIDGIRSDFAAVSWMKSALRVRRGALEVGIVIGVKSGTQIPELCKLIQKRVGEVLAEHLGTCDLAGIGVEVNEIRPRNTAAD
jgi:hypothetical protein